MQENLILSPCLWSPNAFCNSESNFFAKARISGEISIFIENFGLVADDIFSNPTMSYKDSEPWFSCGRKFLGNLILPDFAGHFLFASFKFIMLKYRCGVVYNLVFYPPIFLKHWTF